MGRPPKPYFRASDGWWVSRFRGEYVKLARGQDNEPAARKRFHELMAVEALGTPAESAQATTAALFEAFLDWSHRNNEVRTYEFYLAYLQGFCDLHGAVPVRELRPYHVTRWLDQKPTWNQSTRRCALTAVKRALNWAVEEGYLDTSPLKKVKKPPMKRREKVLSSEEKKAIAAAPRDKAFQDFVFALEQTGCRPGEIAAVTAEHVNLDARTWRFARHKTVKKTNKPRVVFLTADMVELCRRLIGQRPLGRCSSTAGASRGAATLSAAGSGGCARSWGWTRAWWPTPTGIPSRPRGWRKAAPSPRWPSCWGTPPLRCSARTTPTSTRRSLICGMLLGEQPANAKVMTL